MSFIFPASVDGWLSDAEGRKLAALADDKTVLELGSFKGRSTICLAQTALWVHSVDHHRHGSYPDLVMNLAGHGVAKTVVHHIGEFNAVCQALFACFDLVFIDGEHDAASVGECSAWAGALVKPDGIIAWHDYGHPDFPDVKSEVDDFCRELGDLEIVDTLAIVRLGRCSG